MILMSGKDWDPNELDLASWELAYSHIDIPTEMLKMNCWLQANPSRRKTARGMPRFVVSWLGRITEQTEVTRTRDTSIQDDLQDHSWV